MKIKGKAGALNGRARLQYTRMAVIHATRRSGASLRDQFKYGGCYQHEGYDALGQVVKVDAHKGKDLAIKEGWGLHWQGNDAADQTAKTVWQKLVGNEKLQQRAVANLRAKRRQVETLCRQLGEMWKFQFKKTYLQERPGTAPHAVVYHDGQ